MQDGFAATKSHGRIHYLEAGEGPVILLMHSNGNSAYEYDELIALLADRYRVIAMDFPGHGDSEPLKRHYTVSDYGDCAIELMDALDIRTASILGSSIGGAVCIDIGVRHAGRVESLFVVESPLRAEEQWRERWFTTEKGYGILVQTAEQLKPRLRHVSEDLLERWNIDRGKAGTWAMMDVMWALREYDAIGAITSINAKTAVIYGEKSPHPQALALFEKLLPAAPRNRMADCGHFPMLDDPRTLAHIMDDFIRS